jgi:predicted DCC family thiol-disulfide oxidoreductase YuxK
VQKTPALTLYYDGKYAFCTREMMRLAGWDRHARPAFVDMSQPGFDPAILGLGLADLNREMASQRADGQVLLGVDSMLAAYPLVGRGMLVWPLRVPVLRTALASLYRLFARHRYAMSKLLGVRMPDCSDGVCGIGNPFLRGRGKP